MSTPPARNGGPPPIDPPQPVAETLVVLSVLHFADGTAAGTLHVVGPLADKPKTLANMLHDHANDLARRGRGFVLPGG